MHLPRRRFLQYLHLLPVYILAAIGLHGIIRDLCRPAANADVKMHPVSSQKRTLEEDTFPPSKVKPEVKHRHVLILSYQRSGSSFAGELFNQHPEAVYWFEPLDGAYSSMYGTEYGWNVPGDIFTHSNGVNRSIPLYEVEKVAEYLENIFNCNLDQLPTEILAHKFMSMFSNEQIRLKDYLECLQRMKAIELSAKCRHKITTVCPKRFDSLNKSTEFCGKYLIKHTPNDKTDVKRKRNDIDKLGQYTKCQKSVKAKINKCQEDIQTLCSKAKLIVTKTVRATMETVKELLRRNKNLLVIYNIRDPRGLVLSRLRTSESFWSKYASKDIVKEAEIICTQILRDVKLAKELEKSYPGSILTVIYEDLAINSKETLHKIYNFVGLPIPSTVDQWLQNNTHSNNKPNSQTSRVAAKTAHNWTKRLTYATVLRINKHCWELFEALRNPWL